MDLPAVALIVFNRPLPTARVMEALSRARPRRLLVIADGARPGVPHEAELCRQTLRLATSPGWPCTVEVNQAPVNLGCRRRICTGLDWVFSRVDRAIILEDDCVPALDFFPFCAQLLDRYEAEPRVTTIGGASFVDSTDRSASYRFTRHPHVWGWATWRRAWRLNDAALEAWPRLRAGRLLEERLGRPSVARYFQRQLDRVASGALNTWDYGWALSCWAGNGLSIAPRDNLVTNIGGGADATHTRAQYPFLNLPSSSLRFPLVHPARIAVDTEADRRYEDTVLFRRSPVRWAARAMDWALGVNLPSRGDRRA